MTRHHGYTMLEILMVVAMVAILAAIAVPNFLEAQVRTKTSRVRMEISALEAALGGYYADHRQYPANDPAVEAYFIGVAEKQRRAAAASSPTAEPPIVSGPGPFDPYANEAGTSPPVGNSGSDPFVSGLAPSVDPFGGGYSPVHAPQDPHFFRTGGRLQAVTTPVAYYGASLPYDPFADVRGSLFPYVSYEDIVDSSPTLRLRVTSPRYMILSWGPNTDQATGFSSTMGNPIDGPFIPYDPTNGTVSDGDIMAFGEPGLRGW